MTTVDQQFAQVFAVTGPLDAVCCCEPPGARGGSGLPWYHSILNLLGMVKVRRAESSVFLGLRQGDLVYVAFGDDGQVVSNATIPLGAITGAQIKQKNEWTHDVTFMIDGNRHDYAACSYYFGAASPPELVPVMQQMTGQILQAIASRA